MSADTGMGGMRLGVIAIFPGRVRRDGMFERSDKKIPMRRCRRCSCERRCALHHIWVANSPFIRLLSAHRPAKDQLKFLDAKLLVNQSVLSFHIVGDCDVRKCRPVEWRRSIAW